MADDNEREDFSIEGYVGDRDMDNNGIPDRQQPGMDKNDNGIADYLEPQPMGYDSDLQGEHVYRRSVRDTQAHLVASYDVSENGARDASFRRARHSR